MSTAIITFSSENEELGISVEFDPPIKKDGDNPLSHDAAMIAFDAVATEYGATPGDLRVS